MIINKINIGEIVLNVKCNNPLDNGTIQELKSLNLDIYWNDSKCEHWSFDTKLNNGHWLENITYNNELTEGYASIYN